MNRRALESLIKCGSLDGLDLNRRQMLENAGSVLDFLEADRKKNVEGQLGFFDTGSAGEGAQEFLVAPRRDFSDREKLAYEKEVTGMFLSGHPMAAFLAQYEKLNAVRIGDLVNDADASQYQDGDRVTVIGIIGSMQMKVTKSGSTMVFLLLEDMFGSIEVLVFPAILGQYGAYLTEGEPVLIQARVSRKEDEDAKLICDSVQPLQESGEQEMAQPRKTTKRPGL